MYELEKLFAIVLATIIPFIWVFKIKGFNHKLYYFTIIIFFFLYSGIGGALVGVYNNYWQFYVIYASMLSFGIILGKGNKIIIGQDRFQYKIDVLIDKNANRIIIVYITLHLLTLIYPEFLLQRIINPPLPDLSTIFASRFEKQTVNIYQSILYYSIEILKPFFLLSLYKYRKKPFLLFLFLLSTPYITYCLDSYLGRGTMMWYAFIYIVTIWKYNPKIRKMILVGTIFLISPLVIFLLNYRLIRLGGEASAANSITAIETLFMSETSFPLWFASLVESQYEIKHLFTYIYWIITLPLPGFIKGTIELGAFEISRIIHGRSPGDPGFYILLPGIVGESIFYFGKYFFWIHSLLIGFITGKVFNLLNKSYFFDILLFYCTFQLSYIMNRGGTTAAYPFLFKHLLMFFIMIFILTKSKKRI